MVVVKIRNVAEEDWIAFEKFCKKHKKNRSEMLREFIKEAGRFELILSTELRMQAMMGEVLQHLDLNTQAFLLNVQAGLLPYVDIDEEGVVDE